MSKNAKTNPLRRERLLAQALDADFGLDGSMTLEAIADRAAAEAAADHRRLTSRYVNAAGLAALVDNGADWFISETGKDPFPYNLTHGQGRVDLIHAAGAEEIGPYGRRLSIDEADRLIETAARIGGWLKAAAQLPALRRVLERGLSPRGMNSPRTKICPFTLWKKFPSPGKLNRTLWKVRRKADHILNAYGGERAPWADIAYALLLDGRPNRAALIAAAIRLGHEPYGSCPYKRARDWLVEVRLTGRILDVSDGVEMYLDPLPAFQKAGVTVTCGVLIGRYGHRQTAFLVRSADGRTYHADQWTFGPREALREALWAWREQDLLEAEEADLIGFLRGDEGVCPLVTRSTSHRAGNCAPGTEAWLRFHGWDRREWIPAAWLVPHLGDESVRRVAAALRREFERPKPRRNKNKSKTKPEDVVEEFAHLYR